MTSCPWLLRRSTRSRSTRRSSAAASSIRVRRRLASCLLGFLVVGSALAHELGTIRVYADFFKDGTYEIDVVVDRQHLPPGFGKGISARSYGRIENLTPELDAEVGGLIAGALHGVRIAFDGRTIQPSLMELVLPEGGAAAVRDAPELVLHLQGEIPRGVKTFTWANAGAPGAYMLTIREEGREEVERQWLDGAAESAAYSLGGVVRAMSRSEVIRTYLELGFTHILPK